MSDTWSDIQAVKSKQSSLREKFARRKKEREGLLAGITGSGGAGEATHCRTGICYVIFRHLFYAALLPLGYLRDICKCALFDSLAQNPIVNAIANVPINRQHKKFQHMTWPIVISLQLS